jgi:hypothetical protein
MPVTPVFVPLLTDFCEANLNLHLSLQQKFQVVTQRTRSGLARPWHGNPSPPELKKIAIDPSTTVPNMINRVFGVPVEVQ